MEADVAALGKRVRELIEESRRLIASSRALRESVNVPNAPEPDNPRTPISQASDDSAASLTSG